MNETPVVRHWLIGRTQGRWQVLEGGPAHLTAVDITRVVPEAALVESEAREREAYDRGFKDGRKHAVEAAGR